MEKLEKCDLESIKKMVQSMLPYEAQAIKDKDCMFLNLLTLGQLVIEDRLSLGKKNDNTCNR